MLAEGTLLGRYRVDALAAVGGMGAVYRGTDTVLQRAVALKVLPADRAGDASMAERFACESLQAASLSHPHVLPVYDAGEAEGVSYVAMQWVDGATLEQLVVDEGPLDLERAVDVTAAIGSALDHAHRHGLVHRDVKPGNVMVDAGGNAYLMDFGLSVRTDRTSAVTQTGEFLATVDYAAPEQIEGARVDRRTDVYGLAGLAFRCLTGKVPFERDSPVARLYAHLNDEPPAAHELRPAVPPALSETICRGLAKRPEDRPQTAGAFAAELRAALGSDTSEHPMPLAAVEAAGAGAVEATPASRRAVRVLAGAAATVLAAFGGMALAGITGGGTPSGDLPAAGAGPRESREVRTSADTTPAASSATQAATDAPPADEGVAKKAEKRKDRRERQAERRGEADGGLSGAGGGDDTDASPPAAEPSPVAADETTPPAETTPTETTPGA